MNALAHCAEALYADGANPVTSLMAQEGIRVLRAGLPRVVAAPDDIERAERRAGRRVPGRGLVRRRGLRHPPQDLPRPGWRLRPAPRRDAHGGPAPRAGVHRAGRAGGDGPHGGALGEPTCRPRSSTWRASAHPPPRRDRHGSRTSTRRPGSWPPRRAPRAGDPRGKHGRCWRTPSRGAGRRSADDRPTSHHRLVARAGEARSQPCELRRRSTMAEDQLGTTRLARDPTRSIAAASPAAGGTARGLGRRASCHARGLHAAGGGGPAARPATVAPPPRAATAAARPRAATGGPSRSATSAPRPARWRASARPTTSSSTASPGHPRASSSAAPPTRSRSSSKDSQSDPTAPPRSPAT